MSNWLIEKNLNSVEQRWKWLVFGRRVGTVGAVFCLVWFFIQLAARYGVFYQLWIFRLLVGLMVFGAIIAVLVIFLATVAGREKRAWVANALEKGLPSLMDRVNTLIFLEENPRRVASFRLKNQIEEQAKTVFQKEKALSPFSPARTMTHLGIFALALAAVMLFQKYENPFGALITETPASTHPNTPFELAPQKDVTETQPKKIWGEVRIVDPGHDVRLTKVDVLPLQIEMTTSDTMQKPIWVTSIDGGAETVNDLTAPTDPNYMVYQPLIYLDQMKVTEWDVVAYYAKVKSAAPAEYASPINFIEIRPFREDILKMTGDKDGKGKQRYDLLNELTGLIKEQTRLIQETHQFRQTTYPQNDMRQQDAQKLSNGENDLSTSTNHFYGKIASESENTPVGDILDQLSQAEQQMNQATPALKDAVATEGQQHEQSALQHLIESRKAFQKAISDNPGAFGGQSSDDIADQPVTATESLKALSQVSEMHDRDQAAQQALHQLTQREQALAQSKGQGAQAMQKEQLQVKSDLHDLMNQNADLFQGSESQQAAVQENMMQSLMKLSSGDTPGAKSAMAQTAGSMQGLEKSVGKNHEAQQLAQAYKLKKIIDQNAGQLAGEQAKPGSLSDQEVKDLVNSAQRSTSTLKDIVDNDKENAFGPKLGQALSAENQQGLNNALGQFSGSQPGSGRGAAAGEAQKDLQGISQAFDQSQPQLTNQIRGKDQLQPPPSDALDQASQDLQSMILAAAGKGQGSGQSSAGQDSKPPGDQDKALEQVVHELHEGLADPGKAGGIIHDRLLADADDLLKKKVPGSPVDPVALKKLLDEIESVRIEANDPAQPKPPQVDTTQIDPAKFPPAYRDRLRIYFEQLSQQSH